MFIDYILIDNTGIHFWLFRSDSITAIMTSETRNTVSKKNISEDSEVLPDAAALPRGRPVSDAGTLQGYKEETP